MSPALHVRMLRITQVRLTATVVTLKLEGRVAGDWVRVLEEECRRHTGEGRDVQLDFREVSMIDCAGIAMLRLLTRSRIAIVKAPPLIRALLAEEECH
jgi:anti-anti-sigma regulatory factor